MRLDTKSWALIPLAVAVNVAAGWMVGSLKIPLYMDSLGTILAASLAGPLAGAITGAVSNIITAGISNPTWLFYVPIAALLGWCVGWIAKRGFMSSPLMAAMGGILIGVMTASLSAPITATFFHGTTGSGTDFVVATFRAMHFSSFEACAAQGLLVDPMDKMVCFLIVQTLLAAMPLRLRYSFQQGEELGEMHSIRIPGLHGGKAQHGSRRAVSITSGRTQLFVPGNSFLYQISPTVKVLLTLTSIVAAVTLPVWIVAKIPETQQVLLYPAPHLPAIATLLLGIAIIGGVGLQLSKATMVMGLPISASMILINGLFGGSDSQLLCPNLPIIGSHLKWSVIGATSACDAAFRIVIVLEAAALLLLTTRPDILLNAMERKGLPPRLAYVLLASLNLIPTMVRRANEILEAQTARGMPLGDSLMSRVGTLVPMSGPLILGSISEVEERALALEARGFGAKAKRTWLSDPPSTKYDLSIELLLLAIIIACLTYRFVFS